MIRRNHELATWMFAAHHCLIQDGFDADAIMSEAEFDFHALASSTQEILKRDAVRVWQSIERVTGNDAYCLRILSHLNDPYLNALVTSIQACGSIENALQILLKYHRVVHPGMNINVSINPSLKLEIESSVSNFDVSHRDIAITFCLLSNYITLMLTDIKPLGVRLTRKTPQNKPEFCAHFKCPVVFETDENSIEFPIEIIGQKIPGKDPNLSSYLEHYLAQQISRQVSDNNDCLAAQVKLSILKLLPSGTPKLKDISAALDMSERSLQRKLNDEGLSYSALLNDTRIDLAKRELSQDSDCSVQDIAQQLGFTEPGNFIRFFKQHTGKTPVEFAKQVTLA